MKKYKLTAIFAFLAGILNAQQIDIYQRPVQHEPDRYFDAVHYCVELDIDMESKTLKGKTHLH